MCTKLCVTWSWLLHLSELLFPYLNGDDQIYLMACLLGDLWLGKTGVSRQSVLSDHVSLPS